MLHLPGSSCGPGADGAAQARRNIAARPIYTAEKATWMAGEAVWALGGNGHGDEYPADRPRRDAKPNETGAGTSEIRRMPSRRELFAPTK